MIVLSPALILGQTSLAAAVGFAPPPVVACFVEGTLIETVRGPVAVQNLAEGDMLLGPGGEQHRLKWIGWRQVEIAEIAHPASALPVRIRAGALGPSLPRLTLMLSPDHAIYLDGVLTPVFKLIDGDAIAQVRVERLVYYHLECDRHVILVAHGLATESYLDVDGRIGFTNAPAGVTARTRPDYTESDLADLRARLAAPWAARDQVSRLRRAIREQAQAA
jgi:hypothetical protein